MNILLGNILQQRFSTKSNLFGMKRINSLRSWRRSSNICVQNMEANANLPICSGDNMRFPFHARDFRNQNKNSGQWLFHQYKACENFCLHFKSPFKRRFCQIPRPGQFKQRILIFCLFAYFSHRNFLGRFFSDLRSNRSHIVSGCLVFCFLRVPLTLMWIAFQCLTSVTRR